MMEYIKKLSFPIIFIIILLAISFATLIPILDMVILGAIFAYGIGPIVHKLQLKLKYRSISIILAIILLLIPILLLCGYLVYVVLGFASSFVSVNNINFANLDVNQTVRVIMNNVPYSFRPAIQSYSNYMIKLINNLFNWILDYFINIVKSFPNLSIQIFTLIFSTYYFARDGDKLMEYVYAFIPKDMFSIVNKMFLEVESVIKSIFYGHFLTAIIIGIIAGIGFGILGYPYPLFLGIITGICQLIPIFGPWPVYCTLTIIDLFNGNFIRVIFTLIFGCGLSMADVYIRPALAGKYADIHSMVLLLGFMAGPLIFGLIGFILGPLILGITFAVIKTYKEEVIDENAKNNDSLIK